MKDTTDPELYGITWLPDRARASAAWTEWRCIIESIEDGDGELDDPEDQAVAIEVYASLRRMGAKFHPRLGERFDCLLAELRRVA